MTIFSITKVLWISDLKKEKPLSTHKHGLKRDCFLTCHYEVVSLKCIGCQKLLCILLCILKAVSTQFIFRSSKKLQQIATKSVCDEKRKQPLFRCHLVSSNSALLMSWKGSLPQIRKSEGGGSVTAFLHQLFRVVQMTFIKFSHNSPRLLRKDQTRNSSHLFPDVAFIQTRQFAEHCGGQSARDILNIENLGHILSIFNC